MASAKKPIEDKPAAPKPKPKPVPDRAAIAKKRAAAKVEKAKKPVVMPSGERLSVEDKARYDALHKPKPSPSVKL